MVDINALTGQTKNLLGSTKDYLKNTKLEGLTVGKNNYALGQKIIDTSLKADQFILNAPKGVAAEAGTLAKATNIFGKFGNKLGGATVSITNKAIVPVCNNVGSAIIKASESGSTGILSSIVQKVPFISTVGQKLASASGTTLSKVPGLGLIFSGAEALYGVGKAAIKIAQGDVKGGCHQLIQSGGTLGGQLLGIGLIAAGVIASPFTAGTSLAASLAGIAILIGADKAGRYVGGKVADAVCGPVDENGNSINSQTFAGCSNNDFDAQINSIYESSFS